MIFKSSTQVHNVIQSMIYVQHSFNVVKMEWIQAYVSGMPPAPRSRFLFSVLALHSQRKSIDRHTATLIGSLLYIFAGGDDRRLYGDLFVLDTEKFHWHRIETKGTAPCPRWGHTASLVNKYLILPFVAPLWFLDGITTLNTIN